MPIENRAEIEQVVMEVLDRLGLGATTQSVLAGQLLKLAVPGSKFCSFGIATLTWPGGAVTSDTIVVSHGLGAIPESIQATALGTADHMTFRVVSGATDTQFEIAGQTTGGVTPPNTQMDTFYWWAVGG